jgi:hypothetical protein
MNTRIIEVNGVKLEIDLMTAKTIENYKVGDPVKVLVKGYSDSYKSFPGVILSFDDFEKLPTINVVYLETDYSSCALKTVAFNEKSADIELAPMRDESLALDKASVLELLESEINKKREELRCAEAKKAIFIKRFGKLFRQEVAA